MQICENEVEEKTQCNLLRKFRTVNSMNILNNKIFKSILFALLVILLVYATLIIWRKYEGGSDDKCFPMDEILKGPIAQDNPYLLNYVKKHHLIPPASRSTNYNVSTPPGGDPSRGQSKIVLKLLQNKTDGFFVECGASDGEGGSNTLYMERELGWTGLLIEAHPNNVKKLKHTKRKSWLADVCLSRFPYPERVMFGGRILNTTVLRKNEFEVQCVPLYTLLLAIDQTYVDYFSLDIEGDEVSVFRSIPFDKVTIKVISVEFNFVPEQIVRKALEEKGYVIVDTFKLKSHYAWDLIAIRKT